MIKYCLSICLIVCSFLSKGQEILPPQLIYPSNKDILMETLPVFSWINVGIMPVALLNMGYGRGYSYEIKIVEMIGEQSPEAAIVSNMDFYRANADNNLFMYPLSAPKLEKGKDYAWQIKLNYLHSVGETSVPKFVLSEAFMFSIADLQPEKCVPILKQATENKIYSVENYQLSFEFEASELVDRKSATYRIIDMMDKVKESNISVTFSEEYGIISLKSLATFRKNSTKNDIYVLEASLPSGKKYVLKFICQ